MQPITINPSLFSENTPLRNAEDSTSQTESANCTEQFIRWLRSDENPLLLRIGAVSLIVIGTLGTAALLTAGVSLLLGNALLASAIVLVPTGMAFISVVIWGCVTANNLQKQEDAASRAVVLIREHTEQARQALTRVQEAVGGEEAFNQFPILNLGNHLGATGYLDFLQPEDLAEPIMRGVDATNRPFISLRLRTNDHAEPFVVTFFQRYRVGVAFHPRWTWGTSNIRLQAVLNNTFSNVLGPEGLEAIRHIVVDRNHPELTLV